MCERLSQSHPRMQWYLSNVQQTLDTVTGERLGEWQGGEKCSAYKLVAVAAELPMGLCCWCITFIAVGGVYGSGKEPRVIYTPIVL